MKRILSVPAFPVFVQAIPFLHDLPEIFFSAGVGCMSSISISETVLFRYNEPVN